MPLAIGETAEKIDTFFSGFTSARRALLLLDYDGTLAPFRVDRFTARPWVGVRTLLDRIQKLRAPAVETRMAIVTGRPAAEIAPMLGLDPPLEVWGLHGAERLYADGKRELEQAPEPTRSKLDELRQMLKHDSMGGLFEDKPNAVVMHWRGVSAKKARQIERRALDLFEPVAHLPGLALLEFDGGIELRVGRNKGGAVEAIRNEMKDAVCPVAYLGDDLTDEAAFRAVNGAAGAHLSALVRRKQRETEADIWLKPPQELRDFLERWARAASSQLSVLS